MNEKKFPDVPSMVQIRWLTKRNLHLSSGEGFSDTATSMSDPTENLKSQSRLILPKA